jgi:hypothetical protein
LSWVLEKWLFAGDNYLLLARTQNEKMMATAVSIVTRLVSIHT